MTLNLQLGESQKKVTLQFEVKQRKAALLPHVWHSCWKCLSAGAEKMRTQRFSLVFRFHFFTSSQKETYRCIKMCQMRLLSLSGLPWRHNRVVGSCRGWCEAFSVWVVSRYKEVRVFLFLTQQTASRRPACRSRMLVIQRVTTWRNVTPSVFVWLIMQEQTRKYR